jgi:hypothetical protein
MLYRIAQRATLPVTRQLLLSAHCVHFKRIITPAFVLPKSHLHSTPPKLFASSHDWQQPPKHPLIDKIQQHPHIMEQLVDFTTLLQSKGVDVSGKQPSFMQIMKVMNDPEIKEKVQKLAQDMQAAGIQLDMSTIQELQSSFGNLSATAPKSEDIINEKSQLDQQDQQEEERGRKRGVMNRVKGLFKK